MMHPSLTERQIRDALKQNATVTDAAKSLGISRFAFYRLMAKHGIQIRRIVT